MAEKKAKDNMELWNKVCKTDPAITKRVTLRGGFTSIDAQSQIKRATELWGPYGGDWGMRECHYDFINTPSEKGEQTGIYLIAIFYYPEGEFSIASDMYYQPHNDCMKKLLTDVTTKALSKLGFNSDVFEGKFDDNKYVEKMKMEFTGDYGISETAEKVEKALVGKSKAKLPDNANQYLTVAEIKDWEDWKATPQAKLSYAEEEIKHREHLNMSFGKMKPVLLSLIREVRKKPDKYDWKAFKKAFPIIFVWFLAYFPDKR